MNDPNEATRARLQVWLILVATVMLFGLLRLAFGPLPQNLAYHALADTLTCLGIIPRAGDVLTNLAILAAGLFGLAIRPRMGVGPEARTAVNVLIAASILTAFGSAYYHWAPSNATLVWDRLPMALVLTSLLALVMADRMHPLFARVALWPFVALGAASVILWGASVVFWWLRARKTVTGAPGGSMTFWSRRAGPPASRAASPQNPGPLLRL